MTPEGRVKKMVKKALDTLGPDCWRFMPVQTGFGVPALDFLACIRGKFVAIETKAPGKKLTDMQEATKAAMEAAGGIVLVVWDEGSLAIAVKIILALEFSGYDKCREAAGWANLSEIPATMELSDHGRHVQYDGAAARTGTQRPPAENKRTQQQYLRQQQLAQAAGGATGGDHGAPAEPPQGRAEPSAHRKNQRVTATVTYRCACCGDTVNHPSMLRSIPWCANPGCDLPMNRVVY